MMNPPTVNNIWFQYWQRRPQAHVRLFCFPYAGGGASIYRLWPDYLPQQVEVCPVQLPGRENRLFEEPFSQIGDLIDPVVSNLLPYLDMPFAFFGHSMGSLICFEVARQLYHRGYGQNLLRLFVSGHRAPQNPDPDPPINHLPEPEFVEELRHLKGTSEEILANAELLRLIIPLLRADFMLCETYIYADDKPLQCPITAFGGLQDAKVLCDALAAWRDQTYQLFKMRLFVGDHFFLQKQRVALLQAIALDLQ